jgi:hypothetical protein
MIPMIVTTLMIAKPELELAEQADRDQVHP